MRALLRPSGRTTPLDLPGMLWFCSPDVYAGDGLGFLVFISFFFLMNGNHGKQNIYCVCM